MEDSFQKINESKINDSVSVPDTSSEKFKDNLEKKFKSKMLMAI